MTPLLERLMIIFPPTIARMSLVLIYAALMFGTVVTIGSKPPDVLYLDVPQGVVNVGMEDVPTAEAY